MWQGGSDSDLACMRTYECQWITFEGLHTKESRTSHYIASTYWVFTTITTVGYGLHSTGPSI